MTQPITYGDIQLAKMTGTYEPSKPEPHTKMNRFEKMEFISETTARKIIDNDTARGDIYPGAYITSHVLQTKELI